jgi:hypothetical protein
VAVFGTTISPYLFFWQAAEEVEDEKEDPKAKPLIKAPLQAPRQSQARSSLALFVGALITAIGDGASEISQLREVGHPNPTIVHRSVGEAVHARPNVP